MIRAYNSVIMTTFEPVPDFDKFASEVFPDLKEATDRVCAVLGVSHLDVALTNLFQTRFIKVEAKGGLKAVLTGSGALASLNNKTEVAYLLGWISDQCREDISRLAKIRNLFAHSIERNMSFDTQIVADHIKNLSMVAHLKANPIPDSQMAAALKSMLTNKNHFMSALFFAYSEIAQGIAQGSHAKERKEEWISEKPLSLTLSPEESAQLFTDAD